MEERYCKRFALTERHVNDVLAAVGAPVTVVAGALSEDSQGGTVFAQIKFRNVSESSISSMKVELLYFDADGKPIACDGTFEYERLSAAPEQDFGEKTAIVAEDRNAYSFSVDVISVKFSDGTSWRKWEKQAVNVVKETVDAAKTVADSVPVGVKKATKKTAKLIILIPALLVNAFVTAATGYALYTIALDAVAAPGIKTIFPLIFGLLCLVVSIPGFGRLVFRKKYGIPQRILRWVVYIMLMATSNVIMRIFF